MICVIDSFVLRKPEHKDIEALYKQKNDPDVAAFLGGFSNGYSRSDLADWLDYHGKRDDEVIWVLAETDTDRCIGHVGFYHIDYRARSGEFAIMIGDKSLWGKGIGKKCTRFVISYGFSMLNLNRIYLTVLATNERAIRLYNALGFKVEGVMRQAQYKNGHYIDLVIMSLLREEFKGFEDE